MNPPDPRDPTNLIAFQIFFGDQDEGDRTSRRQDSGGCGSFGCALVLLGALLFFVVAAIGQ